MIAVNELIQKAYEALNMTGLGEATDGTMAKSACGELNELISQLNSEGYISHMQKFLDVSASKVITFRKLPKKSRVSQGRWEAVIFRLTRRIPSRCS